MFQRLRVANWSDLLLLLRSGRFGRWMFFRGERERDWELKSSLERAVPEADSRARAEREIIRHFRERAHNYLPASLIPASLLEWVALIQHHGGPTRLIDFTSSRWVALFFALEHTPLLGDYSILWALDPSWLRSRVCEAIAKQLPSTTLDDANGVFDRISYGEKEFNNLVLCNGVRTLYTIRPMRLSERVTIQQGQFLCVGDVTVSAIDNWPTHQDSSRNLFKIEIPASVRVEALRYLSEHNISRATLFPGIDGFAQSLAHEVLTEPRDVRFNRLTYEMVETAGVFEKAKQRAEEAGND